MTEAPSPGVQIAVRKIMDRRPGDMTQAVKIAARLWPKADPAVRSRLARMAMAELTRLAFPKAPPAVSTSRVTPIKDGRVKFIPTDNKEEDTNVPLPRAEALPDLQD